MKMSFRVAMLSAAVMMIGQQMLSAQDDKTAPAAATATAAPTDAAAKTTPLNVDMKTIAGKDVNLAKKYEGKVILLVNVASKCGNTPQYEQLQALHAKYAEQGLAVVGLPCNQFRSQEPGTAEEILAFCKETYGVEFDLLAKADVNGPEACELYKFLTSKEKNAEFGGDIPWNFEKFLFSRDGQVVARVNHRTKPDAPNVVQMIEAELAKKATVKPTETKPQAVTAPGAPSN